MDIGFLQLKWYLNQTEGRLLWAIAASCSWLIAIDSSKPIVPISTVPKKDFIILLPYLGSESNQISKRLKSCVNRFYSIANVKVIFLNTRRIKYFFAYKDRLNRSQRSKVVYTASCTKVAQQFQINGRGRKKNASGRTTPEPHFPVIKLGQNLS